MTDLTPTIDTHCDTDDEPDAYERAAERLADATEDLLFCEDTDGKYRAEAIAAWQNFVRIADA